MTRDEAFLAEALRRLRAIEVVLQTKTYLCSCEDDKPETYIAVLVAPIANILDEPYSFEATP